MILILEGHFPFVSFSTNHVTMNQINNKTKMTQNVKEIPHVSAWDFLGNSGSIFRERLGSIVATHAEGLNDC